MKKIVLALLLAAFGLQAKSQNTGYLGKHVILKTDVINGKRLGFQNLDLEVVKTRQLAFTASFRNFAYAGTFRPKEIEKNNYVNIPTYLANSNKYYDYAYTEFSIVTPGQTKGLMASLGAKYYFSHILPAPSGLYTSAELGFGQATFTYLYRSRYEPFVSEYGRAFTTENEKIITESNFLYFALPAVGYQTFLSGRFAVDAKVQFEGYINNASMDFIKKYPYPYLSSNLVAARVGNTTFGPAIYGKVGFLLF